MLSLLNGVQKRGLIFFFGSYFDKLILILDAVYTEIGGSKFESISENRYPGFLAEHFFNLWIHTYAIRKYEVPIVNV